MSCIEAQLFLTVEANVLLFSFLGALQLPVSCLESCSSWESLQESPYVSACAWRITGGPAWVSSEQPTSMPSPLILVSNETHFWRLEQVSWALLLQETFKTASWNNIKFSIVFPNKYRLKLWLWTEIWVKKETIHLIFKYSHTLSGCVINCNS